MSDIGDVLKRFEQMESRVNQIFGGVNLGDWSNDQEVPWWLAQVINPQRESRLQARAFIQSEIVAAVQLAAQTRGTGGEVRSSSSAGDEYIDNWCGTRVPGRLPRPRWSEILSQLTEYGESLPANSNLRRAAADVSKRLLERGLAIAQ